MYRRVLRVGRRWSSSARPKSNVMGLSERPAKPGTVRVTKGYGADKHEAELDSTLARIIGSDWGDRSHQPVSLPMRLYWLVFGLVLVNGVYTYVSGKDESFLVEKLKEKADKKLGVEQETNEFEDMADGTTAASVQPVVKQETPSVLKTRVAPAGLPFMAPTNKNPVKSKTELEQQLAKLRTQQKRLQKQISSSGGVEKEELEHQVRMLDIQKEQVKQMITSL